MIAWWTVLICLAVGTWIDYWLIKRGTHHSEELDQLYFRVQMLEVEVAMLEKERNTGP